MSVGSIFSTLTIGFLAVNIASPTFAESLNESVYKTGTVLGRISIEKGGANGSPQTEEVDAMIKFFKDGAAEFDFQSLADSSISCSGELIFIEYTENTDWQILELQLVPEESNSDNCPPTGYLTLARRPDATNSDPIKVGFRPDAGEISSLFLDGAVYLTEGVPEYREIEAEDEVETAGGEVEKAPTSVVGSSTYPSYDGVYVGLVDGTYVPMEELVRADSRLHFGGMPYAITRPFGDPASNRPAPVVDVDEIRSIFVKSRSDVITSIQPVFDAEGLLFQGGGAVPNAWVLVGQNQFPSSEFKNIFASSDCSFVPSQMNRLSISDTEYELVFEGSQINPRHLASGPVNKKWSAANPSYSPDSRNECAGKVSSRGFSVVVEGPTHRGINTILGPLRGSVYWVQFADANAAGDAGVAAGAKARQDASATSNSEDEDMQQTLLRIEGLQGKVEIFNVQMFSASLFLYSEETGYFSLVGSSGEVCKGTIHAKSKAPKEMSFDVSVELPEHEKCAGVTEIVLYQSLTRKEVFMADFWSRKPGQTDITLAATGLFSYVDDENPITSVINTQLSDLGSPLSLDPNEFPILGMGD